MHFTTLKVFFSSPHCRCRSAALSGPMRPANRLACIAAALLLLSIAGAKALDIKDPRAGSDRAPLKVDRWVRGVQRFSSPPVPAELRMVFKGSLQVQVPQCCADEGAFCGVRSSTALTVVAVLLCCLPHHRVAFNAQQQGQFRRRLLSTGQPAAVPQKQQTAVREMAAASNRCVSTLLGPASPGSIRPCGSIWLLLRNPCWQAASSRRWHDDPFLRHSHPIPARAVGICRATAIKAEPAAAAATAEPSKVAGAAQAAAAVPAKPSQQDPVTAAAAADAPTSADAQQQEQQVLTKEAQQALLAGIAKGLSAHPKKAADKVQEPAVKVEEMTLEQLLAEDAPPTTCRGQPATNGIKWNVGCADKPLGGSCNGIVLSGPPFCDGQGGSIATIKCMPDGEWGSVQTLC